MAKYMLLIYGDEQRWENLSAQESAEIDAGHVAFQKRAGDADSPAVTDGPFLETKEVLGGFYLLEAADLDEAVALSRELAEVRHQHSGVEIKPLVQHG